MSIFLSSINCCSPLLRYVTVRIILTCLPRHFLTTHVFLTTHFPHNPLIMASDPTTLSRIISSPLLPMFFPVVLDFSDACAIIKVFYSSLLVFYNSIVSPSVILFLFYKCVPPIAYSLNADWTQEFHSHLILYHSVSAMPSMAITSMIPICSWFLNILLDLWLLSKDGNF